MAWLPFALLEAFVVPPRFRGWLRSPRVTFGLGILLAVGSALIVFMAYRGHQALYNQYDDSYITFRYAVNLARGRGFVFNVGEHTDSASSFAYTLLLAGFYGLGATNLEVLSTIIGLVSLGTCVAAVYWACVATTDRIWLAAFLAVVTGLHGLLSGWTVSGMESVFYAALVALAVLQVFFRRKLDWGSTVLVALVALTRTEGILLVPAWGWVVLSAWSRSNLLERRRLQWMAASVGGTLLAFVIFKWVTYGTLLPHSYLLKRIVAIYQPNPHDLWEYWKSGLGVVLLLSTTGLFLLPRTPYGIGLAGYVLLSLVSLVLGPSAEHARYSVHMLPVLAMLSALPLAVLVQQLPLLAALAIVGLGYQTHRSFKQEMAFQLEHREHQICRKQVGRYIEKNLHPQTPIISSDIGAIAYTAPSASFIDTVGLTNVRVAQRRTLGLAVDVIFLDANAHIVADTCHPGCDSLDDFSANDWLTRDHYWTTPLSHSALAKTLGSGPPLEKCRSPDGNWFAVSVLSGR